ncbi:hypothetical protein [Mycobacterium uberis]|uniref:hypothetical protein n=1 Tax=Mycobacterium uberis TaxID=2162698 RepID=UPI000E30A4C7|nr:hypothetical protein [Mycobacterium uberis]
MAQRRLSPQQAQVVLDYARRHHRFLQQQTFLSGATRASDTPRAVVTELLPNLGNHELDVRLLTGDHPIATATTASKLGMAVNADQITSNAE